MHSSQPSSRRHRRGFPVNRSRPLWPPFPPFPPFPPSRPRICRPWALGVKKRLPSWIMVMDHGCLQMPTRNSRPHSHGDFSKCLARFSPNANGIFFLSVSLGRPDRGPAGAHEHAHPLARVVCTMPSLVVAFPRPPTRSCLSASSDAALLATLFRPPASKFSTFSVGGGHVANHLPQARLDRWRSVRWTCCA